MTNIPQLEGKVAIVTGGSSGIGLAIAKRLIACGANVTISGRDAVRLEHAAQQLPNDNGRLCPVRADVRDPMQVKTLFDRTVKQFGAVDILINNAGIGAFAKVADLTLDQWHAIIETNLNAVFYCCREAIPYLRQRNGGWLINISSLAGKNSFPGGGAYCASKAALNAFSEVLMQEVRHEDIRVNYIMPGSVATSFNDGKSQEGADWKIAADDVAQVVLDVLSLNQRSLVSRVEVRPSKPKKNSGT